MCRARRPGYRHALIRPLVVPVYRVPRPARPTARHAELLPLAIPERWPALGERLSPRCAPAAITPASLSKHPGLTIWASVSYSPDLRSQTNKFTVNFQIICESLQRVVWTISVFLLCTGCE